MTDFDAASALLMLSSGYNQYKNENNNIPTVLKSANNGAASSSPPLKRERKNGSPKQRIVVPKPVQFTIAAIHENFNKQQLLGRLAEPLPKRMGSSSPDVEKWDSRESTLSPTLEHSTSAATNASSMLYASPGMNGFAMLLKSSGNQYTSSPDAPSDVVGGTLLGENNGVQFLGNNLAEDEEGAGAIIVTADKPARSPSDSGVSSILDELQQPVLERWGKDMERMDTIVPAIVQMELDKINETSAYNKDIYTKSKLASYPVVMTFNAAKSRIRKEITNEIDHQDRMKNNEASRRSRHKKKLITHMLNISLDFDRMENRQLYMEERRLTNLIMELEEKALNRGIDAQVIKKIRDSCGFQ